MGSNLTKRRHQRKMIKRHTTTTRCKKKGGFLPILPPIAALLTLVGGAACITKAAINAKADHKQLSEAQGHNCMLESIVLAFVVSRLDLYVGLHQADIHVKCEKKYHLEQHKNTAIHMKNSGKKTGSQPFFPKVNDTDKTQEQFSADLCSAMVASNIPRKKLENPDFNAFLNKYTNMTIPDESTLRKHYLHSTYLSVVQTFDEEQTVAITEENAAISYSSISADLAYVKINFGNLPGAITALEARDLPLVKAVKIMRGIEENLNQASGSVGTAIVDKFNRVLQRNPGWKVMANTSDAQERKKYIKLIDSFIETKHITAPKDYLKAKITTEVSRRLTKERFGLREESFDDYSTKYNPEPISLNETGQTNIDMFTSTVNDTFEDVITEDANSKTSEMVRFSEASLDDRLTQNITRQDFFSENEKSRRDVPVSTPIETVSLDNTTTLGDSAKKYFANPGSNVNGFMPKRMTNLSSSQYLESALINRFLGSPPEIEMGYMGKLPYQIEDFEHDFLKDKLLSDYSKIHFANKNRNVSKENETVALKHGILGLLREQQGDDVLNKYSDTFGHEAFLGGLFPMRMMPETTYLKDRWVDQPFLAKQSVLIFYAVNTLSSCMAIGPQIGQQLGQGQDNVCVHDSRENPMYINETIRGKRRGDERNIAPPSANRLDGSRTTWNRRWCSVHALGHQAYPVTRH
uniref:Uncharacterized protein n=1 Tax=Timema cristinae TaxID=61476 RepID=A0A7R9CVN8_TIMCR|nr:unnamed protein product [Timema cristinae]